MGSIAIVGLGGDPDGTLAPPILERLSSADRVVVPSPSGEAAERLAAAGIETTSFGDLGLAPGTPSVMIVETLSRLATDTDVILATVDIFPAVSPLVVLVLAFDIGLTADLDIVNVAKLGEADLDRDSHLIVVGVRNAILARKAAEGLAGRYPPDHQVVVAGRIETDGFDLRMTIVSALADDAGDVGAESALYVPPSRLEAPGDFADLVRIVAVLRTPEGCPWDLEQTPMSLRQNLIEEAYEVVSAIEATDHRALADELGDLLLQIVFQARMAADEGLFDISDVTFGITEKLRRRHPHIFGKTEVADAEEVIRNWEAIKRDEKPGSAALDGVPAGLPSLARAQKISRRVAGAGFDWETVEDVWVKVHEEIEELKAADRGSEQVAEEVGDVLFTIVNVARKLGVDAEIALRDACDKFTRRFAEMERAIVERGLDLAGMDADGMERLWQDAKERERAQDAG